MILVYLKKSSVILQNEVECPVCSLVMIKHLSNGITNECDGSLPLRVLCNLSYIVAAPEPRDLVIDVLNFEKKRK